ncbi:TetR/AcrR family transcriptional regulator [Micromonospora sp. PPF5-17]|uniref:TetR/AcrR family transcriptional regulator n=2 Tax=Micromonosporaceae TaxID=28056 RepID=A0ABX9WF17_9ACTN|nr:TetR/AcrR family transcriptional regulator [Micromonospora solifontis]NES58039.1 TetR/AcrR family transcriptional regulator [Micromonospora sp. PPF5-6]RNL98425.1 TetR/AcrR family transcriptional regulator [Micromonospora solifontis]
MARSAAPGSRERILRTAGDLFYRHGVRAVGMNQVIGAAGCGKNLLYTHFPSKDELVAAYLRACRAVRDRDSAAATAGLGGDPAACLRALVAEIAASTTRPDFRGCAFRMYLTEFPEDEGEPARVARDYLRDTRAEIDDLVARLDMPNPEQLADRIWLIVEGLYASAARPDAATASAAATQLVDDLLAAATPR